MADTERKSLVWNIRKSLLSLSSNELFQIAEKVGSVPGRDPSELSSGDAEGCFEYIHAFMYSKDLLDSEDSGMGELLALNDVIEGMVQSQGDATLLVGPVSVNVTSPPFELAHTATAKTSSTDTTRVATVAGANPHVAIDTADNARPANSSVLPDDIQQMFSNYEDLSKKILQFRLKHAPKRQIRSSHDRLCDKDRGKQGSGTSCSDSDESTAGYWLRVPVRETRRERGGCDHYLPAETHWDLASEREDRHVPVSGREERHVNAPADENGCQRDSQPVARPLADSPPPEMDSEGDGLLVPNDEERFSPTPVAETSRGVRRSARERRPRQLFTYETLGEPSLQPRTTVNAATTLASPFIPAWPTPYHITPLTGLAPYIPPAYPFSPYNMPWLY
ncbi:hypothetical protein GBF38_022324 [Nibea albiflora]|uniref:Uncharacterized protein n=1 Tax=Nibea albiflora TaxID=240163 RepID=A0ACB7FHS1_NIBAL|nr:hypothetical protein GBF38_022324 [Nibea albiflora]